MRPPTPGAFRCASCGQVCPATWTDAEVRAEAAGVFGLEFIEQAATAEVCDPCYQAFRSWWDSLTVDQQAIYRDEALAAEIRGGAR